MEIKYKMWLEKDGEVVAGNGKVDLLKMIDELGSIQKAAENYGMSYRHAWGIVQKMERRSGIKLLETQVGGKEGGGARVTLPGKRLLKQYDAFRKSLDQAVASKFKGAFKK
jgi:molybdate transport repressor ModE-like protein